MASEKSPKHKHRGLHLRGGVWHLDIQIEGRRIRQSTGVSSFTMAKKILDGKRRELARQQHLGERPLPKTTLGKLVNRYLCRVAPNVRDHTSAKPVLKYFGADRRASAIATTDILSYCEKRAKDISERTGRPLSSGTQNRERAFLKAMFSWAVRNQIVVANPAQRLPMLKEPLRQRIPSRDELGMLLHAAKKGPRYLYAFLLMAACTGARRGELLNLTWDKIDWRRKTVWFEKTKSGRDRHVPMNLQVIKALQSLPRSSEAVFVGRHGHPIKDVKRAFETARRRARLDRSITLHSLRHSFGTMLAENGVDAHTIRELMGHSGLAVGLRYIHVTSRRTREAVQSLPELDHAEDATVEEKSNNTRVRCAAQ